MIGSGLEGFPHGDIDVRLYFRFAFDSRRTGDDCDWVHGTRLRFDIELHGGRRHLFGWSDFRLELWRRVNIHESLAIFRLRVRHGVSINQTIVRQIIFGIYISHGIVVLQARYEVAQDDIAQLHIVRQQIWNATKKRIRNYATLSNVRSCKVRRDKGVIDMMTQEFDRWVTVDSAEVGDAAFVWRRPVGQEADSRHLCRSEALFTCGSRLLLAGRKHAQ